MKLIFATSNEHKAAEIRRLVGSRYEILTLNDLDHKDEIPETGVTLKQNAALKSAFVADHFATDCFADDSGLEVAALNGAPGVYSARYAGEQKNNADNIRLLLERMRGEIDRSARFVTVISLNQAGKTYFFEGILEGTITTEPKGSNGFGYDPVFIPIGDTRTLAEHSSDEKNAISHRAKAFEKMRVFLAHGDQQVTD